MNNGRLSSKITDDLKELIATRIENNGNLKLPSEQQLAMKYRVSRGCIRKALNNLIAENLIYTIMGKGSFINVSSAQNKLSRLDRIAFIFPEPITRFPWKIFEGIKHYFKSKKINVLIFPSTCSLTEEEENLITATDLACKGIILMPIDLDIYNKTLLRLFVEKFPIVLIDRTLYGLDLPIVSSDHFEIGYKAAKYLGEIKKHDNIAYITIEEKVSSINQRINGFFKAASDCNNNVKAHIYTQNDFSDKQLATFIKNNNVTGILVNSGQHTQHVLTAFEMLKMEIKKDFDIVAIDDNPNTLSQQKDEYIPKIVQDTYNIGIQAATLLFEMIYLGKKNKKVQVPLKSSILDTPIQDSNKRK